MPLMSRTLSAVALVIVPLFFVPVFVVPVHADDAGANAAQAKSSEPVVIPLWTDEQLGSNEADDSITRREREAGNAWVGNINRPTLTVYRPDRDSLAANPTRDSMPEKLAVVVCPGGGYGGLAIDKEGHDVAKWLASQGVTAGVLTYRCGGGENQHPVPMNDARRAVEIFRENASAWMIAPDRVGIIGFSAGGHLASTIATDPQSDVGFAALIYPVISMAEGVTHGGSKKNLIGAAPDEQIVKQMSRDEQVSAETCPTFLVHAGDDLAVPVENSIRFYQACLKHRVPAEMHVYPNGGHGFGMFRGDRPVDQWPERMREWLTHTVFPR